MVRWALCAALVVGPWPSIASAELIVNDPQPITRRVTVQLIQTALDDGTSPATAFGTPTQRAAIETGIDTIWSQAGIDVAILAEPVRYNDTFAYQGNAGSGTRPSGDLSTILSNARNEGGILHADPLVLNMFFVNVVPAFKPLPENNVAGIARIGANGIAAFVGDSLLTFGNGRDSVASVIAHEIGHNLGLIHVGDDLPNLMSPGGDTEQLNASQIDTARASSFARVIELVLAGDYNGDDVVDAGDYVVWRNSLNEVGFNLPADGNHNGRIDLGDYTVWKQNYGAGQGAGGISTAAITPTHVKTSVPEPNHLTLGILALFVLSRWRRKSDY
jgi:hypothetical protein